MQHPRILQSGFNTLSIAFYSFCNFNATNAEKKIRKAGVTRIVSTNTIPGKTAIVDISNTLAKAIT